MNMNNYEPVGFSQAQRPWKPPGLQGSIIDIISKVSLAAAPSHISTTTVQDRSKGQKCTLRYMQEPRSPNELQECIPVKSAEESKSLWGEHQDSVALNSAFVSVVDKL